jgi:predicted acetyltransferase
MSSIDNIVNDFDIGFFSVDMDANGSIKDQIGQFDKPKDFSAILKEISKEEYTPPPPSKYVQLDGFTLDENNNKIPSKITLKGLYRQESFLDENGNWDKKAEAEAYKKRELDYKKEVIDDWLKNINYDLHSKAELMKALLAKTES